MRPQPAAPFPRANPETAPANWTPLSKTALASAKQHVDFTTHVKPILQAKCLACHSGTQAVARFSMETRTRAFEPGAAGPRIIPGQPERSPLVHNVSTAHANLNVMPPVGQRILPAEMDILRRWIKQGAAWPSGPAGNLRAQR